MTAHRPGVSARSARDVRQTPHGARKGRQRMTMSIWKALAAAAVVAALTGCAPLLIGGGAAIVADEAIEQDQGGDGLF